ncbi:MAG: flavodoxin family protein [Candidatus Aenigmatarchaeota archaeon]
MKTLVVYHSRTGNTRKVAERIARALKADLDEIVDKSPKKGMFMLGMSAFFNMKASIETKKDSSSYDLVVIGTPVWAGRVCPPVKTYISKNTFKRVAFFCTCDGDPGKVFEQMTSLVGHPLATVEIINNKRSKDIYHFCRHLR